MSELPAEKTLVAEEVSRLPAEDAGVAIIESACPIELDKSDLDGQRDVTDDLTSLEREIAEMHHVDLTSPTVARRVNNAETPTDDESDSKKIILEITPPSRNSTPAATTSLDIPGEGALADEDLIAVLKGTDADTIQKDDSSEVPDGVTIEGEGQFQIMEVFDCDVEEPAASGKIEQTQLKSGVGSPPANSLLKKRQQKPAVKLTREEERAVAMEQMEGLKAKILKTAEKRRRKQDIVPLSLEGPDLVSTLGAEWSDDDITGEKRAEKREKNVVSPKTKPVISVNKAAVNVEAAHLKKPATTDTSQKPSPKIQTLNKAAKSTDEATNVTVKQETESIQPQTTGFTRTRIIKRKIIWDPDAPETQFSYAQLVRNSSSNRTPKSEQASVAASAKAVAMKKDNTVKKVRPVTPRDKKLSPDIVEKKVGRTSTPKPITIKTNVSSGTPSVNPPNAHDSSSGVSPGKRRSQTPVSNGAGAKKKKVSEIDRLMGDEGAVNMLNSLENERNKLDLDDSSEKPHKPLMRSRAVTVPEKATKRETTPVATKKDPIAIATKAKRTVKPKASATWDYVYQQQSNDDSMIIRRRSNSSYSSNASLHRLSLDGPITPRANSNSASATKSDKKTTHKTPIVAVDVDFPLKIPGGSKSSPNLSGMFEFAKPESKSQKKNTTRSKSPLPAANALASDMKKASTTNKRAAVRSPGVLDEKDKAAKEETAPVVISDVIVKKSAKTAQIIFNTHRAKRNYTFTVQMMNKLVEILNKLKNDNDCNAVVLITNSPHFCQGIDFTDLISGSFEKRQHAAIQLAIAVKSYLKTLVTFSKPIITGINGNIMGLGVTQLPLFDIVIAGDKSTYETPYAKIGQLPEGYCIWNLSSKIRGTFRTKLFWLCERLHSTETALSGLVNKLTTSQKVNDEALSIAKKIASLSPQACRAMKERAVTTNLEATFAALDKEFEIIHEQWVSTECYENLKKLADGGLL